MRRMLGNGKKKGRRIWKTRKRSPIEKTPLDKMGVHDIELIIVTLNKPKHTIL